MFLHYSIEVVQGIAVQLHMPATTVQLCHDSINCWRKASLRFGLTLCARCIVKNSKHARQLLNSKAFKSLCMHLNVEEVNSKCGIKSTSGYQLALCDSHGLGLLAFQIM